jgi:glycosyltransferase involved in cell wall biosynthesis
MIFLIWFILGFSILRLLIAALNLTAGNRLTKTTLEDNARVSVLIPARNEEESLPTLLDSLLKQSHQNLEIIVYDDESTDRTRDIVQDFMERDHRVQYLEGIPLPNGWLGKNHACDQLAKAAGGDYLLFMDADLETGPDIITSSLHYLKKERLSLLSIFPVQKMYSFGEWITVPLMNWILLSLLPLMLIRLSHWKSFSAANGQFMLFPASLYRENLFHQQVKNERVEDIEIMRLMKSKRLRVATLPGNHQLKCRMYGGFREAVHGFSKNVVAFFGKSYFMTVLFVLLTSLGWLPFVMASRFDLLVVYFAAVILMRLLVSIISRQNVVNNMLLIPLQELSLVFIVIQAFINKIKNRYVWKGRIIR